MSTDPTSEQDAGRDEPRVMLALITLATDLPVPKGVTFSADSGILSMDFSRIADGQAWSAHLGGSTDTYVHGNGRRYLREGVIAWQGWRVQLFAAEDAQPDSPLGPDTTAGLRAVTESQPAAGTVVRPADSTDPAADRSDRVDPDGRCDQVDVESAAAATPGAAGRQPVIVVDFDGCASEVAGALRTHQQ